MTPCEQNSGYAKKQADELRSMYAEGRKCVAVLRHVNGTVCFFDGSTPDAVFAASLAVLQRAHLKKFGGLYARLGQKIDDPALTAEFVEVMPDSPAKVCALAELESYARKRKQRDGDLFDLAWIEDALARGDGEHAFAILHDMVGKSLLGHAAAFWVGQLEDLSRWAPETK